MFWNACTSLLSKCLKNTVSKLLAFVNQLVCNKLDTVTLSLSKFLSEINFINVTCRTFVSEFWCHFACPSELSITRKRAEKLNRIEAAIQLIISRKQSKRLKKIKLGLVPRAFSFSSCKSVKYLHEVTIHEL